MFAPLYHERLFVPSSLRDRAGVVVLASEHRERLIHWEM
jgi:hypothetical protein